VQQPDIILLHGALGAADQFAPYMEMLSEKFHVHQLDFEGHGPQADSGRAFRIGHFVENLAAALDKWELRKANIFGYSMGGYVALALALREPGRVGRIATLGTKFLWTSEYASGETKKLDPLVIEQKVPHFARTLEDRHTGAGWHVVLAKTAEMMVALGQENVLTLDVLSQIENPVRVMVGDRDVTVGVDEAEQVCRALKHGELVVLADTPHPIERVNVEVLVAMRDWLAGS